MSNLIQHLNYIVDPQSEALPDYNPPGGVTGGANPGGGGPAGDGAYPDPTEQTGNSPRNPFGRRVRFGGTGIQAVRKKKKEEDVTWALGNSGDFLSPGWSASGGPVPLSGTVDVDDVIIAVAEFNFDGINSGASLTLSDSMGNGYVSVGSVSFNYPLAPGGTPAYTDVIQMWYALASSRAASPSVTLTSSENAPLQAPLQLGVTVYKGVHAGHPLIDFASHSGTVPTTPALFTSGTAAGGAGVKGLAYFSRIYHANGESNVVSAYTSRVGGYFQELDATSSVELLVLPAALAAAYEFATILATFRAQN